MQKEPNKQDLQTVALFEKTVKNINQFLKGKSAPEIDEFFDIQDKKIKAISIPALKDLLLEQSNVLRNSATSMTNKFDSIINRLEECDTILIWKSPEQATQFFDEIDSDISMIPDQRIRHLLVQQSNYFRKLTLHKITLKTENLKWDTNAGVPDWLNL